jgi:spore coat protein A
MVTRRQVLGAGAVAGAAVFVPAALRLSTAVAAPVPGGTLDPNTVAKYVAPLFVLPAMPKASSPSSNIDAYSIAARQISQQILPSGCPTTNVFAYGSTSSSATFHYPSLTIEATTNRPVRVTWANQLVDGNGKFLPHLLPVDPTLHWANPPGGTSGRDSRPTFTTTPGAYRGPVPFVTHLHGAHVFEESDGYPEAWYLPNASNIPSGYATVGSFYNQFKSEASDRFGANWPKGAAIFQYPNDQRATGLWFHSHELGLTRLNIYAGLAGQYLLRGGSSDLPAGTLPGPAPKLGDPSGTRYYEIPLMIQDRSFNSDGSLFFPSSRDFFGDVPAGGPYIPTTDVSPIWNPEFFGNTMVVNGRTWPKLNVEPRRYRFRLVNACNTRVVMLKVASDPNAPRPTSAALPIWIIGTDGGFLPRPVQVDSAVMAVAERLDVIIDFTGLAPGTQLYLINEGPDEPFGGGSPGVDFTPADPGTTGQVMKFIVGNLNGRDTSTPPSQLTLPSITGIGSSSKTRRLSLNEMDSTTFTEAPTMGMLGTLNSDGTPNPLHWGDALTENVSVNTTETWELYNFTEDAHPIHLHQVQFQVVNRQTMQLSSASSVDVNATATKTKPRPPQSWETGFKDTVVALPGEVTRLKAKFDLKGRFVWHCHIIDHEDNEMMRPYQVS